MTSIAVVVHRWVPFSLVVVLAVGVAGCGGKRSKFKKEYKMQVNVGPSTYWGMGAAKFAELASAKTGGKIKVKPYYGSQLLKGSQLDSSQMVAVGAIDCAFESTINSAPVIPEMNVFCLPFFVNTYENLDKLESGETGGIIFEKMRAKGLEPLAWGENGFRQLTNANRSVTKPEDLKNLRVRVVGSPIFIDIFRQLGADPIDMNWGDAVTAFQQGTVDGQENPAQILLAVQIWQYQKHVTRWNYVIDPLILYWNKSEWDAFPEDVREGLKEAATEAAAFQKALARAGLDGTTSLDILKNRFDYEIKIKDPVAYLKEKGMTVSAPTDEERAAFAAATKPVLEKWSKKLGSEIMDAAKRDAR